MHAWEQIQLTVDYIKEHIPGDIPIERLAGMAALSPFYYQRLFSRLVKKPVGEYIKLRRMAKAAELLPDQSRRILDVALDLGFSSHEHFSRTFKATFGLTPEAYRKAPFPLSRMTKPELSLHYTLVDENVPLVSGGIVLEITRKRLNALEYFLGLEAETPAGLVDGLGLESGVDPLDSLWRAFHQRRADLPALIPGGGDIGVAHPGPDKGHFRYFAGALASSHATAEGCEGWTLPVGEYVVCTFETEDFEHLVMDALYKAQQYLFGIWLPGHGLATEPFCAERYRRHTPDTTRMELWVKPLQA